MKVYIKIILISMLSMMLFSSCITKSWAQPKYFTNHFENKDTGLSQLLDTNGAFLLKYPTGFEGYIIFFDNGLMCYGGNDKEKKNYSNISNNKSVWGTYSINKQDSIIDEQIIVDNGIDGFKVNRHFYKIINRKQIQHIGYISYHNEYIKQDYFGDYVPAPNRIDSTNWLLKKKWFWKKGAKK